MSICYEVSYLKLVYESIQNLIGQLYNMGSVIFVIFYIFAVLGMMMFGGHIKQNSSFDGVSSTYLANNFNDGLSSLVTLYSVMIVSTINFGTVSMFEQASAATLNKHVIRFYFIIFWYLNVIIGMNLIISFVLETYGQVYDMDKERQNQLEEKILQKLENNLANKLKKIQKKSMRKSMKKMQKSESQKNVLNLSQKESELSQRTLMQKNQSQ